MSKTMDTGIQSQNNRDGSDYDEEEQKNEEVPGAAKKEKTSASTSAASNSPAPAAQKNGKRARLKPGWILPPSTKRLLGGQKTDVP